MDIPNVTGNTPESLIDVASFTKIGNAVQTKNVNSCHVCVYFEDKEKDNVIIKEFHITKSFEVIIPKSNMKSVIDSGFS